MVKETRIVFELKDIISVRVQCGSCNNEVVLKLNADACQPNIPLVCPHCQRSWRSAGGSVLAQQFIAELHRELRQTNGPFKFLLELADD